MLRSSEEQYNILSSFALVILILAVGLIAWPAGDTI